MQPPNLDAPVMLGAPNPAMTTQVNWQSGVLTVPDMREDLCGVRTSALSGVPVRRPRTSAYGLNGLSMQNYTPRSRQL